MFKETLLQIKRTEGEQPPKIFKKIKDLSVSSPADFQEKFRVMTNLAYLLMEIKMEDWSYDEELSDIKSMEQVLSHLKSIILLKNNSDNYFLRELARAVYENEGDILNLNQEVERFEITEGIFSWHLGDTIRISSPGTENHDYIERFFSSREEMEEKEELWEDTKEGHELMSKYMDIEYHLEALISKDLKINDLIVSKKTSADKADFKYFLLFSDEPMRNVIEKQFGFEMKKLSLPEQFRFLQYIKNHTINEMRPVEKFIQTFGESGARTFLSIEHGGKEMGDKILELGEKLPKETAEKVFAKYSEIIDMADNTQKTLEEILPSEVINTNSRELGGIKESLLIRAKELLSTFYNKKENNNEDLLKDLERYKAEILLYADTYKKINQSGKEIKLEDIKNTGITILSQEEKEKLANELWDITKANRSFIKETDQMEKRKKDFYSTIDNKDSDFYVLKHKENIIAFCSFTPDKNGNLYAESLNIEPEIKGAQIGSEFFPAVLEKVKKLEKDIYGYVHGGNKGTLLYYRRIGFEIKEIQKDGELKYEIRIPVKETMKQAA